jgi:hypothetical protein
LSLNNLLILKSLSFLKYFATKNLLYLRIKNTLYLNNILFFFQSFGFVFFYKSLNIIFIMQLRLSTYNSVSTVVLFLKLSNRISISHRALRRLTFLAPSLFLILKKNKNSLINHIDLLKSGKGGQLRGFIM